MNNSQQCKDSPASCSAALPNKPADCHQVGLVLLVHQTVIHGTQDPLDGIGVRLCNADKALLVIA